MLTVGILVFLIQPGQTICFLLIDRVVHLLVFKSSFIVLAICRYYLEENCKEKFDKIFGIICK